jgi:hypothetical protein
VLLGRSAAVSRTYARASCYPLGVDLPNLTAPHPPAVDLSAVDPAARTIAMMSSARQLHRIVALPALERLWISGVTLKCAEIVGAATSLEHLVVHDLRVADLRWLAGLVRLRSLAIAGSTRLKRLDGIESLTQLTSLTLFDVGVEDLAPLSALCHLESLCIEGGMSASRPLRPITLAPLASLVRLERLRLASLRVADRSLRPLHGLVNVRDVFIADMFPPTELRALALVLPDARGEWLDTYRRDPDGPSELRKRAAQRRPPRR